MARTDDDLLYLPLGGVGEIGMNLSLYGWAGRWLMVDLGVTFPDPSTPGVELVVPDPSFITERLDALDALVLTHAHEDHLGAVPYLWRRLRCPVYATPFSAAILRGKLERTGLADEVELIEIESGGRLTVGAFDVEYIPVAHSIPEAHSLAIRTPAGLVLHTGDWKIDPDPLVGGVTDEAQFWRLGEEGVLALVGDSTNAPVAGESGSEAAVRASLIELLVDCPGKIFVTQFASNIARVESVATLARAAGRRLVLAGPSLWRYVNAALETGHLDRTLEFLTEEEAQGVAASELLYLCTGCQGEPVAAMARIADGERPGVRIEPGDTVVFSSKIIPGNERAIGRLHNLISGRGARLITSQDQFVHVSGHPCRDELAKMYGWVRPQIAVPVHGEERHLEAHAELAREMQVPQVVRVNNGEMLRLAPGAPETVERVQSGRLYVDGRMMLSAGDPVIRARRKLMREGVAVLSRRARRNGRPDRPSRPRRSRPVRSPGRRGGGGGVVRDDRCGACQALQGDPNQRRCVHRGGAARGPLADPRLPGEAAPDRDPASPDVAKPTLSW